jgi:hypothetical protein
MQNLKSLMCVPTVSDMTQVIRVIPVPRVGCEKTTAVPSEAQEEVERGPPGSPLAPWDILSQ